MCISLLMREAGPDLLRAYDECQNIIVFYASPHIQQRLDMHHCRFISINTSTYTTVLFSSIFHSSTLHKSNNLITFVPQMWHCMTQPACFAL